MKNIWCMVLRYKTEQTKFFVIFGHFLPFYHLDNLENQNSEKMEKKPGYIIILHRCTMNDGHMMYSSWKMKCNGQNLLSLWTIFCPFSLNNMENQNFERVKKRLGYIIILQMCTINDDHMMYGSWDMEHIRFFCHLGPFFALLLPSSPP